jgi:uncharacterized protein (TIGR02466 family)
MDNNFQLHQLWPVPIGTVKLPPLDAETKQALMSHMEVITKPGPNKMADKLEILNDHPELVARITNEVQKFVHDCLGYSKDAEFFLTNSWVNRQPPGEIVPMHNHSNSLISATYYLKAAPNCGRIIMHRRKHYDNMFSETVHIPVEHPTPVSAGGWPFEVEEDLLIMFPSNLEHSVEPNQSDEDRYCLAMNFFAAGVFGYDNITQLEIPKWKD